MPNTRKTYPATINSKPLQSLYDNLGENEELAIAMDQEVRQTKHDDWRGTQIKRRKVEIAIRQVLQSFGIAEQAEVGRLFEIISNQREY